MDKQLKLIDANKLLIWVENKKIFVDHWLLSKEIGLGTFDPDPTPVPTIKPGDRVNHDYYDEGTVKVYDLYGDGRALVEFDHPDCGERLIFRSQLEVIPNE